MGSLRNYVSKNKGFRLARQCSLDVQISQFAQRQ